jgi:putative endonuclease
VTINGVHGNGSLFNVIRLTVGSGNIIMTNTKIELGAIGEALAVKHLKRMGYKIVEQNFRVRTGEIDIIAVQDSVLVFVEVKTRMSTRFGPPFESITAGKKIHLSKVALEYMSRHDCHDRPARFDVVGVQLGSNGPEWASDARIEIIKNAFDLCYGI